MNVTPKAGQLLRSLPEDDAALILDAACRIAQGSPRRLITTTVALPGGEVSLTIGRPVSAQGTAPVLLTISPTERITGEHLFSDGGVRNDDS